MILKRISCSIAVPSGAPSGFTVTASSSTNITASWRLPPEVDRNGKVTGFKLFYKEKGSSGSQTVQIPANSESIWTEVVSGLKKYTEYEFQVLAYTSVGDGRNSSVIYSKTKEDGKKLMEHDKQYY